MAPKLNCLSIFCCAEAYWNPSLEPAGVLADFGRLVFEPERAAIGPLMEEFEVIPDWGYYAPFPYSPQRLQQSMARLLPMLEGVSPEGKSRLPLAATMAEYRQSLCYYADLFGKLASLALDLEQARDLAKAAGGFPPAAAICSPWRNWRKSWPCPGDFPELAGAGQAGRPAAASRRGRASQTIRGHRLRHLQQRHPGSRRSPQQRRHEQLVQPLPLRTGVAPAPSVLKPSLRATGKPYLWIGLGHAAGERAGRSAVGPGRATRTA